MDGYIYMYAQAMSWRRCVIVRAALITVGACSKRKKKTFLCNLHGDLMNAAILPN
jgi:hypothetical protein